MADGDGKAKALRDGRRSVRVSPSNRRGGNGDTARPEPHGYCGAVCITLSRAVHMAVTIACLYITWTGPSAARQEDRPPPVIALRPGECAQCRIRLVYEATLGPGTEAYGGVSIGVVKRDSRGRYYHPTLYNPGTISVFNPDGSFLKSLGRYGEGPGEYKHIGFLLIDSGDSLHVFDHLSRRYTVLTPDYSVARSYLIPARIRQAVVISPGRLVVSAEIATRNRFGYPFHIVERGEVTRSFGGTEAIQNRSIPEPLALRRVIAGTTSGFLSGHRTPYTIEEWDAAGQLVQRYERTSEPIPDWLEVADPSTAKGRLNAGLFGLELDESGLLWLQFRARHTLWEERAVYTAGRGPAVPTVTSNTGNDFDLYAGILEVVDPRTREIIATLRAEAEDEMLLNLAGSGRVAFYHESGAGMPEIRIYRAVLDRQ